MFGMHGGANMPHRYRETLCCVSTAVPPPVIHYGFFCLWYPIDVCRPWIVPAHDFFAVRTHTTFATCQRERNGCRQERRSLKPTVSESNQRRCNRAREMANRRRYRRHIH